MSQNLQIFAKSQKNQLDNLVDFEKCCKTRIYLQKSVPIQPKTSNILPKICQNWQLPYGCRTTGQDAVPLLCALAVAVRRNVMSKDEALLRSELKKMH